MINPVLVSIAILISLVPGELTARTPAGPKPLTVLIGIDGFKPDYLKRGITPNLSALAQRGALAEGMTPAFPSVTFPNHISLVTGVVPDKHGVVNNTMQDPTIPNTRFRLADRAVLADPKWWTEVKPIWVTAHRQKKLTSTLFWPGSEVLIEGLQPDDWLPYQEIPSHDRVVKLLEWLDRPNATRADFATLYFSEVDILGHQAGVDSPQTNAAIQNVDQEIGAFIAGLEKLHLKSVTNLVIVSDHGMANTSPDKVIALSDLLPDLSPAAIIWTGAFGGIEMDPSQADAALAALKKAEHMSCWRKSGIPAQFQFGSHRRVPEVFCLADLGWTIINKPGAPIVPGQHGYDPAAPDMRALFLATGPAIKKAKLGVFKNTDVYQLLCKLAGIDTHVELLCWLIRRLQEPDPMVAGLGNGRLDRQAGVENAIVAVREAIAFRVQVRERRHDWGRAGARDPIRGRNQGDIANVLPKALIRQRLDLINGLEIPGIADSLKQTDRRESARHDQEAGAPIDPCPGEVRH